MKLSIPPDAIDGLLRHPLLAAAEEAPDGGGALHAVYFDTAGQDLRNAGLSLRVRRQGDRWIQTVKAERGARGLVLDRSEWETEVPGPALDAQAARGTALEPLLAGQGGFDGIGPAFTARTDRQAFLVTRDDALIELVIDRATIEAGERVLQFGEIELELKDGGPAALFGLALDLSEAAPARLSLATKSERGYALRDGGTPKPVKAKPVALPPDLTSAEAFQIIARACLAQAVQNEAIMREHRDPEALHQFRVGLRRLRAAASLFRDMIDDKESRAIRTDLRWLNHRLGPVRDLDVLVARLRAGAQDGPALAAAERRRAEAYDALMAQLEKPRARRTVLATAAWIETGRWLKAKDPERRARREESIAARAADELARRWRKVLKRTKHLAELDPESRHAIRIEIKKLRYGAEFFSGLFTGKKAKERRKAALATLEEFQEILGELNDIAVGGRLLDPAEEGADAAPADSERRADELIARAEALHRDLAAAKPFWE